MKVSLCGPHSSEASTFGPTLSAVPPVDPSGPPAVRSWNLFHQVGWFGLSVCAAAGEASASERAIIALVAAFDGMGRSLWFSASTLGGADYTGRSHERPAGAA